MTLPASSSALSAPSTQASQSAHSATLLPALGTQQARLAAVAALGHAQTLGVKINVAVVDRGGHLLAFLRMDDAFLHSIDKAYSAVSFNMPTSAWPPLFEQDPALARALSQRPRLVPIGGGLPLQFAGTLVGGIGVSGASAEQDEACALAGLRAIGAGNDA
ncbi:GlcG/HbpS family heme-binding protein [Herbaspirillum chlorophenolicum]|jgi:uncharacterized protein GlcG (DUF336 family)|uniref:GlcG/HbpS family heme-binding protein n=1 Tax=Herbaspirillum chlorophenolicum TaxID=211589 RepID=UPI0009E5CCCF|nr:heme-binding protein [Herbaspirillum chlorophenolicum]